MKIQKEEIKPVCHHCEKRMDRLVEVKGKWYESLRILCCPHCGKVIYAGGHH